MRYAVALGLLLLLFTAAAYALNYGFNNGCGMSNFAASGFNSTFCNGAPGVAPAPKGLTNDDGSLTLTDDSGTNTLTAN